MSVLKPLVVLNGQVQQIQSGTTIVGPDGSTAASLFVSTDPLFGFGSLTSTGIVVKDNAGGGVVSRSFTSSGSTLTISNADGVSGNPNFDIAPNVVLPGFGSVTVPKGGTSLQPGSVSGGQLRYNTDTNQLMYTTGTAWVPLSSTVGTVTSVNISTSTSGLTVGGGPVTGTGTLTVALDADLQALSQLSTTGLVARTASATYTPVTITGTALQIDVANGNGVSGNPTISIDAGYVGQSSITTLGTVGTGTWNATTIAIAHGGTGATTAYDAFNALSPTTSTGDLIIGTGSHTNGRLGIGSSGQVLTVSGGTAVWAAEAHLGTVTSIEVTTSAGLFVGASQPASGSNETITTNGQFALTLSSNLQGLSALTTPYGFVVNDAAGNFINRSITPGAYISITNQDGVASSPTITHGSVPPAAGGTMQKVTIDAYGHVTAENPILQADLTGLLGTYYLPEAGGTMTGSIVMSSGATVTGIPTPLNSTDAASKAYVDAATSNLNVHQSCVTATTVDLGTLYTSVDYLDGTADADVGLGIGATLSNLGGTYSTLVVDGHTADADGPIQTIGYSWGCNYAPGTYTNVAASYAPGFGPGGVSATVTVVVNARGIVSSVAVGSTPGSGYVVGDVLTVASSLLGTSFGSGLVFLVTSVGGGGGLTGVTYLVGGSGYDAGGTHTYTNVPLTYVTPGPGGLGTLATANITVTSGVVTAVTLVNTGIDYNMGDVLTTSNTNLGGSGSGFEVLVGTVAGDRFLVKNQATQKYNGIYNVLCAGDGSTPWVLIRSVDANNHIPGELAAGDFTFVTDGSANTNTGWTETYVGQESGGTIKIGTDPVIYTQFSGAGTYIAGTGLDLTGTTFSVKLGAGIEELPGGNVGIDLYNTSSGALILTDDGTTRVTTATSKLQLLIPGSSGLTQDATGLYIASGAITNAKLAHSSFILDADGGSGPILNLGDTLNIQGTAARITTLVAGSSPTLNYTIDISASYAGQASITTLGTIATGTWHGTTMETAHGGTGLDTSSAANGALLIGKGAGFALNTLTAGTGITVDNTVAGHITISNTGVTNVGLTVPSIFTAGSNITTTGNLSFTLNSETANLVLAAPDGSSGVPTFRALVAADLPSLSGSYLTSVTISGGTTGMSFTGSSTPGSNTITLTGTLDVDNGGTGFASYTIGDLLYAGTTTSLAKLADAATGNVLLSGGVGVAPSYGKVNLTTAVSNVLPIANGGTGQATSAAAFNALSPITSTGDLIIGTGVNTAGRLGVGANGQVLTVISGSPAWTSASSSETTFTNDHASPITVGQVVYVKSNGNVDLAKADAAGTSTALGLVADASIANGASGNISVGGIVSGLSGLTPGATYYLSAATAGALTSTAPSTAGQYVVNVGVAISATAMKVNVQASVLL